MTIKNALAIAALGTATLAAGIAGAASLEEVQNRGTLRVGMLVDFPPFGVMDASGNPAGYDAEVAQALGSFLGTEVEIVPVTGPNRIPYLLSGQVDTLVASLGITPERAERVDFSDPYAGIEIMVYGKTDLDIESGEDLADYAVGVTRASTQDTAVTNVAAEGTEIRRFDDDASAVQALLSGQVDLIGVSNVVSVEIEKIAADRFEPKFPLSSQVQGIAVEPGSDEFLTEINAFVDQALEDGTLDQIHQKYLGTEVPDFVREGTAEEAASGQ